MLPMIKRSPNGPDLILLSFGDWTPDMMALASKLHMLPKPEGEEATHEMGIDRLHNLPWGDQAIAALFDVADMLEVCPNHNEVIRLGKTLLKINLALNKLLAKRAREGAARQERRTKTPVKVLPIRTTGKYGFRRRNCS